jgi:hypothetical protein
MFLVRLNARPRPEMLLLTLSLRVMPFEGRVFPFMLGDDFSLLPVEERREEPLREGRQQRLPVMVS